MEERRSYDKQLAVLQESVTRLNETTDSLRGDINGLNREIGEVKGSLGTLITNLAETLSTMQKTLASNAELRADVERNKSVLTKHGERIGKIQDFIAAHTEEHKHTTFEKSLHGLMGSKLAWAVSVVVAGALGILATKLYELVAK